LKAAFDCNYIDLAYVVTPTFEKTKAGPALKKQIQLIMNSHYERTVDRFADFLKKAFEYRVPIDRDALRCVQGLIICISTILSSTDRILRVIGPSNINRRDHSEVFICYLHGLLERTGKYKCLKEKFTEWLRADPSIETRFADWLEEMFGHRDKDVFIDVLRKVHYPPLNTFADKYQNRHI
jgi:hypothetical protein